jgi:hypothetical protein
MTAVKDIERQRGEGFRHKRIGDRRGSETVA